MDWNLNVCARRGHETYAPDDEPLAVVATSIFLPWEIYELLDRVTVVRVVLLAINVAAVLWLIWSKRLFGIRGGGAAYHAEHHAESLLTVELTVALSQS